MAQHIKTGKQGEALALEFIKNKGYKVLATNWRYRRSEVDIIAMDQKTLVFIEVKTRSNTWEIRFDIIAIVLRSENDIEIQHYIDAFFPGLSA